MTCVCRPCWSKSSPAPGRRAETPDPITPLYSWKAAALGGRPVPGLPSVAFWHKAVAVNRGTTEKLALFRRCFSGRRDVYGTRDLDDGRVWQVKRPVTDAVLYAHLRGEQPYGVYLLTGDRTSAVVADFDTDDLEPAMAYREAARGYELPAYIERSKSKGYHAWIFLESVGTRAATARRVVQHILDEIRRPHTEVFPKHDRLSDQTTFGSFIFAPLFGRLVPAGRTVFLDPSRGFRPYPDQWAVLAGIERVSQSHLDDLVEINELGSGQRPAPVASAAAASHNIERSLGLPPCARRMLATGVSDYQRVSCFRLAVHLKKAGLPHDLAERALLAWAAKNRPAGGKGVITPAEIEQQTRDAFNRPYRSCGCEDPAIQPFCDPSCPLRTQGALSRRHTASATGPHERPAIGSQG